MAKKAKWPDLNSKGENDYECKMTVFFTLSEIKAIRSACDLTGNLKSDFVVQAAVAEARRLTRRNHGKRNPATNDLASGGPNVAE